jgi:hypothetical protein
MRLCGTYRGGVFAGVISDNKNLKSKKKVEELPFD